MTKTRYIATRSAGLFGRLALVLIALTAAKLDSYADGIVSKITSSPVFANGDVDGIRSGINVFLQSAKAPHERFLDPAVIGYGIKAGGRMEIELVSGFERDRNIKLDATTILLVAGTPQQAITSKVAGYQVSEGSNENTFVITPNRQQGMVAETLIAKAPAAKLDPIPQRGIKIIHIGRNMAFINRGPIGVVAVKILEPDGSISAQGIAEIRFAKKTRPQIFPTNIPDEKRNRNWQRAKPGQAIGFKSGTLPFSFLLFDRNEGFGNKGLNGVGILSKYQLAELKFAIPEAIRRYNGGLILQDVNQDGLLDPNVDRIIGGITESGPKGAVGNYVVSPIAKNQIHLSRPTGLIDKKAGKRPGGSILDVFFVAGDKPGLYHSTFSLLRDFTNLESGDGSAYTYTVVVN